MAKEFLSDKEQKVLEVEVRKKLYYLVKQHAGSHFRELERKSGLSTGSVQYHLDYLSRQGLIQSTKENNSLRYFPKEFKSENKKLMGFLRQKSIRDILLFILLKDHCSHEDIARSVNISPSTVTWHLKKLEEASIIIVERKGRKTHYTLSIGKVEIMNLLISYQESFLDGIVDNIVEMWDTR